MQARGSREPLFFQLVESSPTLEELVEQKTPGGENGSEYYVIAAQVGNCGKNAQLCF